MALTPEEKAYLAWRKLPQVGCMFARVMSLSRLPAYKQTFETVRVRGAPHVIASHVAGRVDQLVKDPAVDAVAFLFPRLKTIEASARVFLALGAMPGWTVTKAAHDHPTVGKLVAVGLSRDIPFQDGTCPSEALVLGPFKVFPATRNAPLVALEMFVGTPRPFDPKDEDKPTTKANLAHMSVGPAMKFKKVWELSVQGRRESLGLTPGQDDVRAKAKVAFVVPETLASQLGCLP